MRLTRADLAEILAPLPPKATAAERLSNARIVFDVTGKRASVRAWLNDGTFYHNTHDRVALLKAARLLGLSIIRIGSQALFQAECQPLGPSIDMALVSGRAIA